MFKRILICSDNVIKWILTLVSLQLSYVTVYNKYTTGKYSAKSGISHSKNTKNALRRLKIYVKFVAAKFLIELQDFLTLTYRKSNKNKNCVHHVVLCKCRNI